MDRAQRREEELAKLAKEMEDEDRLVYKATPPAPPEPHVSETAQEMNRAVGGRLPSSWLHHQGLKPLVEDRDFNEVCDVVTWIGQKTLPAPEQFFEDYSQHLQDSKRGWAEIKDVFKLAHNRRRRTGLLTA